jgi:hypothetical protein
MDFNYLYHRQQVSLFRADNAACPRSREAHLALARGYATRIEAKLDNRRRAFAA